MSSEAPVTAVPVEETAVNEEIAATKPVVPETNDDETVQKNGNGTNASADKPTNGTHVEEDAEDEEEEINAEEEEATGEEEESEYSRDANTEDDASREATEAVLKKEIRKRHSEGGDALIPEDAEDPNGNAKVEEVPAKKVRTEEEPVTAEAATAQ